MISYNSVNTPKAGWEIISLSHDSARAHALLTKKLDALTSRADPHFTSMPDLVGQECIKSCVRAMIRFSREASWYSKSLLTDIVSHNKGLGDYYTTQPYLLYHLPRDNQEKGTYHIDTPWYKGEPLYGKSFTCWTSINPRPANYQPLTLISNSHRKIPNRFFRLGQRLRMNDQWHLWIQRFLGNRSIDVGSGFGTSLIWHSDLIHVGNFNSTNENHFALKLAISEKPIPLEPTKKIVDWIEEDAVLEPVEFDDYFERVMRLRNDLDQLNMSYDDLLDVILAAGNRLSVFERKFFSFCFALIAQRTPSESATLRKIDYHLTFRYDLASMMLGRENLVSLERVVRYLVDRDRHSELNRILALPSRQFIPQEITFLKNLGILVPNSVKKDDLVKHQKHLYFKDEIYLSW